MGHYILSSRIRATVIVVALTSLLQLLPFAFLMSGIIISLMTLRRGLQTGLQVLLASLVILQLFSVVAGLPTHFSLIYVALWLPAWIASGVLRLSQQQGLSLLVVALLAGLLIVLMYMLIGDVAAWWQQWLERLLQTIPPDQATLYKNNSKLIIDMLNALVVAGLMLNIIITVFSARWWQSRLFNPGAFQQEFYALHLPPVVLLASVIMVILTFLIADPWQAMLRDILVAMMFMYLIQGLSAVHRNIHQLGLSIIWLVLMYLLLVLWPPMILLLSCLGMVEVYVKWHRKSYQ